MANGVRANDLGGNGWAVALSCGGVLIDDMPYAEACNG